MTFQDVEQAREKYFAKNQTFLKERSRKRKKASFFVFTILFLISALILFFNFDSIMSMLHSIKWNQHTLLTLFIIVFNILVVVGVIFGLICALTNGGANTQEEYLAYKHAYKGYFIAQQLAETFTDLNYHHEQGLDKNILAKTDLIYTGSDYSSNDLVIGKYKNVDFTQADVKIIDYYTDSDGDRHSRIVFLGRYMIFKFPKKFKSKMIISFNGYGEGLFDRITTESTEFNKRFLVYAEDKLEALYILTPDFMEKLEKLGQQYDNKISFYFADDKLYIGINDGNNVFEPPNPATPIDEAKEKAKVIQDMKAITNIVDDLKLNR